MLILHRLTVLNWKKFNILTSLLFHYKGYNTTGSELPQCLSETTQSECFVGYKITTRMAGERKKGEGLSSFLTKEHLFHESQGLTPLTRRATEQDERESTHGIWMEPHISCFLLGFVNQHPRENQRRQWVSVLWKGLSIWCIEEAISPVIKMQLPSLQQPRTAIPSVWEMGEGNNIVCTSPGPLNLFNFY